MGASAWRHAQSTGVSANFSHSAAISLRMARDSGSVAAFASCKQWVAKPTYRSRSSIDLLQGTDGRSGSPPALILFFQVKAGISLTGPVAGSR
jgi:hypothetical protein